MNTLVPNTRVMRTAIALAAVLAVFGPIVGSVVAQQPGGDSVGQAILYGGPFAGFSVVLLALMREQGQEHRADRVAVWKAFGEASKEQVAAIKEMGEKQDQTNAHLVRMQTILDERLSGGGR